MFWLSGLLLLAPGSVITWLITRHYSNKQKADIMVRFRDLTEQVKWSQEEKIARVRDDERPEVRSGAEKLYPVAIPEEVSCQTMRQTVASTALFNQTLAGIYTDLPAPPVLGSDYSMLGKGYATPDMTCAPGGPGINIDMSGYHKGPDAKTKVNGEQAKEDEDWGH